MYHTHAAECQDDGAEKSAILLGVFYQYPWLLSNTRPRDKKTEPIANPIHTPLRQCNQVCDRKCQFCSICVKEYNLRLMLVYLVGHLDLYIYTSILRVDLLSTWSMAFHLLDLWPSILCLFWRRRRSFIFFVVASWCSAGMRFLFDVFRLLHFCHSWQVWGKGERGFPWPLRRAAVKPIIRGATRFNC